MIVVKVGGGANIDVDAVLQDVAQMWKAGTPLVLVHGASDETNQLSEKLGIPPRFVTSESGHVSRFTDAPTLDAFAMASGKINLRAVERLQQLGANAIVGGGIALATGAGLASNVRGSRQVAVAFFGDGATNIGAFHESLNLAAIWDLPVIFVLENNQYAYSVPVEKSLAIDDVADRAADVHRPRRLGPDRVRARVAVSLRSRRDAARSGRGKDPQVTADAGIQAAVQRFVDQGMTDRDFQDPGHLRQERGQVDLAQVVAGVDAEPDGLCPPRAVGTCGECGAGIARGIRLRERAGVQLDPVGSEHRGLFDRRVAGIDEQADPAAEHLQRRDVRTQAGAIADEVEALV